MCMAGGQGKEGAEVLMREKGGGGGPWGPSWRGGLEGLVGRETAERLGGRQKPVVAELESYRATRLFVRSQDA